jgi:hypothetical protein
MPNDIELEMEKRKMKNKGMISSIIQKDDEAINEWFR